MLVSRTQNSPQKPRRQLVGQGVTLEEGGRGRPTESAFLRRSYKPWAVSENRIITFFSLGLEMPGEQGVMSLV